MNNPIILLDFDGVIHSYTSGWQGVSVVTDDPVPGAIKFITDHLPLTKWLTLVNTATELDCSCIDDAPRLDPPEYKGAIVQIYSSRSKSWRGRRAMKKWLIKHGLDSSYITEGVLKFPKTKPAAYLTIDDRCYCFKGKFPTDKQIENFKPWTKRKPQSLGRHCFGPEDME